VRTYRQLAAQLRAQGVSETADRFAHRAQAFQSRVFLKRRRIPQYLGSWAIAAPAGYGFKPRHTLLWYLALIAALATAYYLLGPTQGHTFRRTARWFLASPLSMGVASSLKACLGLPGG